MHDRLPEGLSMGNGRLEATEVQIATKVPGRLAEVLADEGDRKYSSQQLLDQQQARYDTSNSAVVAARAQLAAIKAAIGAAEAQVAQLTSEIDDSSLRAPIDGVIQLRLAEPGEVLGAGGRVLLLIDPSDQYMNLYLPASTTGKLTVGDQARIVLDALPDRALPAKISFVAAKAQFTPKQVETRDERQKLVFRVKLRLTEPSAVPQAKPGMPGAGYVLDGSIRQRRHRNSLYPRIAFMPQGLGGNLYPELSISENIRFFATLFGLSRTECDTRMHALLLATDLERFAERPAGKLSGGM
uniref:HlyD_D23 domain-containing protein n=1 Tax=Steinernema glaseri TaxID=37863 RepID=A0A1I7ZDJ9_9BILA